MRNISLITKLSCRFSLFAIALFTAPHLLHAQTPATTVPAAPDWAQPGSATHQQVPPPADFHRPSRNYDTPIGIFQGQSDIGAALVPGSATYDAATKQYTITSAGYNIWYSRDEFRYLWNKMSGDVSLSASVTFPGTEPPSDRKVVLIIRQNLNDDSAEAMVAEHATGMVHLADRATPGASIKDMQFRFAGSLLPSVMPQRVGIQKHGDDFAVFISLQGEPLHQFGPPIHLHLTGPFYVGIGFCSHYPTTVDTGILSDVALENRASDFH
jgi:hypothetical protein